MDSENSKGKAAKAKDKKKAKKASSSGSSSEESGETSSGGESLCTEAKKDLSFVYIASLKHKHGLKNQGKLCKPSIASHLRFAKLLRVLPSLPLPSPPLPSPPLPSSPLPSPPLP